MTTPKRESGWGVTPATTPAPTGTGVITPPPSQWPTTPKPVRVRWLRWRWQCTDPADDREIEFGHAPTQRRAIKRRDKARNRIHDERRDAAAKRIHDERLEAES